MSFLEVTSLTKKFGGLSALLDVSLKVRKGEILGIIGPNGAGKSTLFNTITGFHKPNSGKVVFDGKSITDMKPNRVAALGLVRTWQLIHVISPKTALENVLLSFHLQHRVGIFPSVLNTKTAYREKLSIQVEALELMEDMGLTEYKDEIAASLPYGVQRILGICMALATKPKLLLLDEPTAGLSGAETAKIIEYIHGIRKNGITVMLVEHDMKVIMNTCDRIIVLNFGTKLAEGTPQEISKNQTVIKAYLGFETKNNDDSA